MLQLTTVKRLRLLALTCIVSTFTGGLPAVTAPLENSTVRIAVEGGFPPFNYLDAQNQLQGFDVDAAKALCEAAKLKCEFVIQEWTGMTPTLLPKKYDAIFSSMSMSAKRRKKVPFTKKYYDTPSFFTPRKGSNLPAPAPADL